MSKACVLDASAALSVLVAGQATLAAKSFFLEPAHEWCAPRLLQLEVRNAIHRLERRGVVAVGSVDERLSLLETEIRFDEWSDVTQLSSILTRARVASLSVYDATYLESAYRGGASLATRDAGLLAASPSAGVETFDLR